MLSICPRSCRCQGRSLSESKGYADSTEKETETEKSFAQDHTVLKRQPQNSNAGPKSPSPCFLFVFFPVAPQCLPQEPVVCGSFIWVQGILKDKSCSAVGFNYQLKLSVFPWLTFPSVCHHFLPPLPNFWVQFLSLLLSLGTVRSLIIYGITWKRMSRGPYPHLVSSLSSSIRKGSRLSSWVGEEGPREKTAPILGAHKHCCPVAPEGFSEESG